MEVKDYDGITPLHLAEEHNHEDCIALLRAYKEEKKAKSTKVPKVEGMSGHCVIVAHRCGMSRCLYQSRKRRKRI